MASPFDAFFGSQGHDYQQASLYQGRAKGEFGPLQKALGLNLTRFDISTKTRVPVTQEWVDEAVAEIVRLNVEIGNRLAARGSAMLSEPNQFADVVLSESDRIWEAVRAASAV